MHPDWLPRIEKEVSKLCNASCTVTDNKRELKTADAILFHLADICWADNFKHGFSFQFPRYRRQNQSWVLFNLEPLPMLFGSFRGWQGIFNLTMSYSTNSDSQTPYGGYRRLSKHEISKNLHVHLNTTKSKASSHNIDYYREKSKSGAVALISNCFDEARRYRLIKTISKFINVEVLGKCGKPCPKDSAWCVDMWQSHQFYLAFENSDCRDYISEKYWLTLERNQIPIVAWKHSMVGQVIPNSYINIYDFPDIESAGAFIKRVGENRTLYNSYFDWKKMYAVKYEAYYCNLCEVLSDHTKPAQSFVDLYGWFANFSCKPMTVSRLSIHPYIHVFVISFGVCEEGGGLRAFFLQFQSMVAKGRL